MYIFLKEGPTARKLGIILLTCLLLMTLNGQALANDSIKIIINKKVNKLAYIKNGIVIKLFPVATGRRQGYTPEGTFKVVRKLVKPAYNKLKIPGGSPRNPLGARWLGLNARGTSGGTYGIHGTNNPKSIGRYASGGCVRMYNQDVIWLYNNTPVGTVVEIINRPWDRSLKAVRINLNGKTIAFPDKIKPYLLGAEVMIPCKFITQNHGFTVLWNKNKKQITLIKGKNALSATQGSVAAYFNGKIKIMNVPGQIKNNTFYLPVRIISESFGWYKKWDDKSSTLYLKV